MPPPIPTATHPHPLVKQQNSDGHRLYPSHKFFQFWTFGKGKWARQGGVYLAFRY